MSIGESFWCDDTEYRLHYLDGIIPVYLPCEEDPYADTGDYDEHAYLQGDYDTEDVLTGDLDVIEAIGKRQEFELRKMAEDDPQVKDYLEQCEEEEAR